MAKGHERILAAVEMFFILIVVDIPLGLLLGLSSDWVVNLGPPSYHATWAANHELDIT